MYLLHVILKYSIFNSFSVTTVLYYRLSFIINCPLLSTVLYYRLSFIIDCPLLSTVLYYRLLKFPF
jgi:hypothetical protein